MNGNGNEFQLAEFDLPVRECETWLEGTALVYGSYLIGRKSVQKTGFESMEISWHRSSKRSKQKKQVNQVR